jgi:hypothetical protein
MLLVIVSATACLHPNAPAVDYPVIVPVKRGAVDYGWQRPDCSEIGMPSAVSAPQSRSIDAFATTLRTVDWRPGEGGSMEQVRLRLVAPEGVLVEDVGEDWQCSTCPHAPYRRVPVRVRPEEPDGRWVGMAALFCPPESPSVTRVVTLHPRHSFPEEHNPAAAKVQLQGSYLVVADQDGRSVHGMVLDLEGGE